MLGEAVGLMNPAAMGMAAAALAGTVLSVALWMLAGRRGWLLFLPAFLVLGMGRAGLEQKICDREQALGVLSLLKTRVPEHDYCFFEHALACAMSWFPGESEGFHQKMHHWRRMLEE